MTVEYVFIRDAAHAMLELALADHVEGETFHVAGSGHTTPRAFLEQLRATAGVSGRVRALPQPALRLGALFHAEARAFADILHLWTEPVLLDDRKYQARCAPPPATSYERGIAETLRWFRAHPNAENAN